MNNYAPIAHDLVAHLRRQAKAMEVVDALRADVREVLRQRSERD